jgi:hypothetical protein
MKCQGIDNVNRMLQDEGHESIVDTSLDNVQRRVIQQIAVTEDVPEVSSVNRR